MADNKSGGFFQRLKQGLAKTRKSFVQNIEQLFTGKAISPETFDDLEEILIGADLGPAFTQELIEEMKGRAKRHELAVADTLKQLLKDSMNKILQACEVPLIIPKDQVFTIMVVGVNGTGKTTTIGKLASYYKSQGRSVLIAAADTFRAAAIEQLEIWSRRVDVPIIKQKMGADPSAVVFDAIRSAKARETNVVIIDTAGRLHTKTNLMEELKKVRRIMGRELPGAPHETLLVLDATTGQNALVQAKIFNREIGVTGLALTKLDGTSKGGIIVRIAKEFQIPIRYIGVGEHLDDLKPFISREFVDALFE
ncbi:MAG: signal recognition particle-docking protein FtsY [Deltaproteobacteria bacterium]|nr:signal recognition particle-docking protein FtsY [Deltaproteobacteria bacterium]